MPEPSRSESAKNRVQSVAKAFAVLRAFDVAHPELTVSDVAARTGLDRGTSFRLIHTLLDLGYVAEVPSSRRYRLTLKCLELGYTPLAQGGIKALAYPLLRELVPEIADAASLGMIDGFDVVYVERVQAERNSQIVDRRIGSRTGAYATALGHAILAFLPRDRQLASLGSGERVKLSENTLVDLDSLLERLETVRKQGYAVSDGENAYGLRTIAAPVFNSRGDPIASVSLTIRSSRANLKDFIDSSLPHVLRMASELTRAAELSFDTILGAPLNTTR